MAPATDHVVMVEEGRPAAAEYPSAGPVYRCKYAKDGLLDLPTDLDSPWQLFRYRFLRTFTIFLYIEGKNGWPNADQCVRINSISCSIYVFLLVIQTCLAYLLCILILVRL